MSLGPVRMQGSIFQMAKSGKDSGARVTEIRNRKASRDYFVGETYEAGIALTGTEIKSIRQGKAQINDAFVRVDGNIPILYNANITEYDFGNINNHSPARARKLLLHKKEILKLRQATLVEGQSIIPLKIYFKKNLAKLLIAVCKGKKLYDKRQTMREEDDKRYARRVMSDKYRR